MIQLLIISIVLHIAAGTNDTSTSQKRKEYELMQLIDENYGKTWIFMPDGNSEPQIAYLSESPGISRATVKDKVNFIIYTRKNYKTGKSIQIREGRETLQSADENLFNPKLPTKIVAHGWRSSESSKTIQNIKKNYLAMAEMNVITVDWSELAGNNFYFTPARQTRDIGLYIAELIDWLVTEKNANISTFHLIGHSLGAHLMGFAGSYTTAGRLPRITGLDPALPAFEDSKPESRLDPSDALFVDVIHTAAGTAGFKETLGTADFYPNGGENQAGCGFFPISQQACSHGRSHEYFAESIVSNRFDSYPCESWKGFKNGKCKTHSVKMGNLISMTVRGVYYLETNPNPLYAKGPI